jgi:hypothetical protein
MKDKSKSWTIKMRQNQSLKMKEICQTINNTGKKYKKSEKQLKKESIPQNTAYWIRKNRRNIEENKNDM